MSHHAHLGLAILTKYALDVALTSVGYMEEKLPSTVAQPITIAPGTWNPSSSYPLQGLLLYVNNYKTKETQFFFSVLA